MDVLDRAQLAVLAGTSLGDAGGCMVDALVEGLLMCRLIRRLEVFEY